MKRLFLLFFLGMSILVHSQDRLQGPHIIYPEDAYYHHGGRIIDITRPPFNASGNGITDDTRAFIEVFNFLKDVLISYDRWQDVDQNYVVYLPKGEYLVSNTLIYEGERPVWGSISGIFNLRFVGELRDSSVIRLKDNCSGFDNGIKHVLCMQKPGYGTNLPGKNEVRNLTINTGSGNPAACGLYYVSANTGVMSDLSIISGDGQGHSGIIMPEFSVQGHFQDITVNGFKTGISVDAQGEVQPVFEYLSLSNQTYTGIHVIDGCPVVRKLYSENDPPSVRMTGNGGQLVLLDSKLKGNSGGSAIIITEEFPQLFARDIIIKGYTSTVTEIGEVRATGNIDEFINDTIITLREGQIMKSLNLPVIDPPVYEWPYDLSGWVNPDTCQGNTDAEKIQSAMNSGKPVIYLPSKSYNISQKIEIPSTVKHIIGMYALINFNARFCISEPSDEMLTMYNMFSRLYFEINEKRNLHIRHGGGRYVNNQSDTVIFLAEAMANIGSNADFCPQKTLVYGRSLNDETKSTSNFKVYGGMLWMLGHKTEGWQASFDVKYGGVCEVLGGYRNETGEDDGFPTIYNENSHVSYIGYTGMCGVYDNAIIERRGTSIDTVLNSELPQRASHCSSYDRFIPMYAGYTVDLSSGTPEAYIKRPVYGQDFYSTDKIQIEVVPMDRDGEVKQVEFFLDNISIGTDDDVTDGSVFEFTGLEEGVHQIHVKTVDNELNTGISEPVQINVLPPPVNKRLGYWPLNGKAINMVTGNEAECSTIHWEGGLFGQSASFNGSGYLHNEGLKTNSDSGSVSLWFKTTQEDIGIMYYAAEYGGNGFGEDAEMHINMEENTGLLQLFMMGTQRLNIKSTKVVNDNQWHHAVVTWINKGQCNLYIDNKLQSSGYYENEKDIYSYVNFGSPKASSRRFKGLMDEVGLYNFRLTVDQIDTLYQKAYQMHINMNDGQQLMRVEQKITVNTLSDLSEVSFYNNHGKIGTDNSSSEGWSILWIPTEIGVEKIWAVGKQNDILVYSDTVEIKVNNAPPEVEITSPLQWRAITVTAEGISFTTETNDPDGEVVQVDFYVNGSLIESDITGDDGFSTVYHPLVTGQLRYFVTAIDNDGDSTSTRETYITISELLHVFSREMKSIHIFPNPCKDMVYFYCPNVDQKGTLHISLHDLKGKLVRSAILGGNDKTDPLCLNLYGLKNGCYLVKIKNSELIFHAIITKNE